MACPSLLEAYAAAGFELLHLPLLDQMGASRAKLRQASAWIEARVERGPNRARALRRRARALGHDRRQLAAQPRGPADDALTIVRAARGPRAVETEVQEQCVRGQV